MKRDMDLVRTILLKVEESDLVHDSQRDLLEIPDVDPKLLALHVKWLEEAGLIVCDCDGGFHTGIVYMPERLTWAGCEFVEAARKESTWKAATKTVAEKTGGIVFEVLKQVLAKLAMNALS